MNSIDSILDFIIEAEKLKQVLRKTRPIGLQRYENSGEHSWHVCLTALMLKDFSNQPIDINKVLKMLIIHDLGEIDSGDTIVFASDNPDVKEKELLGMKRLLNLLPQQQAEYWLSVYQEFESAETAEARFARAMDRIPPLLQNLNGAGHSWRENKIAKEKILQVTSRIADGSDAIWNNLKQKLDHAMQDGILE